MSDCEHGQPNWAACPKCIADAEDRMWEQMCEQKARIAELEALLKETVPNLTRIIRMPNAEFVADAHNKALERLIAALDTGAKG